jgi:ribosomal protein S18 acetylase RimI-like enzyme
MGGPPTQLLREEHHTEVLDFLQVRPLHTFVMTDFIRENGINSPLNRGSFYACRNRRGQLEGVALVGHLTMFETQADEAFAAFAWLAQTCRYGHIILGQSNSVGKFLDYYARKGAEPRRRCSELLFEQKHPTSLDQPVAGLRPAAIEELDLIVPIHAQMAFEESGVNPLEKDPAGFRQRCARRIERRRVWVSIEDGKLSFKADIASETGKVTYLEGVYVHPTQRRVGYGIRCLRQLTNALLAHTESVCLLVNGDNKAAQAFYHQAGYRLRELYQTVYLQNFETRQSNQAEEGQLL